MLPDPNLAFAALSDPTRRALLARLTQGEATVQDLARPFPISQPAISRHLRLLEEAGLIETRVQGSARPRRINPAAVEAIWGWMDDLRRSLQTRYNRLDTLLDELQAKEAPDAE